MDRPVKPARQYNSPRRQTQARETRAAILDAARTSFLERGYAATTVGDIAAAVGVSVETVYKAFGNKAGLVKAIFDVAIVGDDEPVPLQEREMVARIEAESDGRKKLAIYGTEYATRAERAVPVQLLVRNAAASDAGARAVLDQLNDERLGGMTAFAQHLADARVLRKGVRANDARDILWLYTSPEVYERLVIERGWSAKRFGTWIAEQLVAALLPRGV
jgi:AcrR family transcriptional regulator